jgi:hypothetical protein
MFAAACSGVFRTRAFERVQSATFALAPCRRPLAAALHERALGALLSWHTFFGAAGFSFGRTYVAIGFSTEINQRFLLSFNYQKMAVLPPRPAKERARPS